MADCRPSPVASPLPPALDAAENPSDFFRAAIERAAQVALADLRTVETQLPDQVRNRCLHTLSFALRLPSVWPLTRELLLALTPWLIMQGMYGECAAILEQGILWAQEKDDMAASARLGLHLGQVDVLRGNYASAGVQLHNAATLAAAMGDTQTQAACLYRLAWSAVQRSLLPEAEQLAQQALGLLAQDDPTTDLCHAALGRIALYRGEWEAAIACYRRSLTGRRKQGGPTHVAPGLRDLGNAYMMSGRYAEAVEVMQEAIQMFGQVGSLYEQAVVTMNLGITYWYQGDHHRALACYNVSEPVFRRLGVVASLGRLYSNRGLAYRDLGRFDQAEETFVQAIGLLRAAGAVIEVVNALESLSGLYVLLNQRDQAITFLYEALRYLEPLSEKPAHVYNLIVNRLRELEG